MSKRRFSFTHFCRPRASTYEPPEEAPLDDAIIKKAFTRAENLVLGACKEDPRLNAAFLIAFTEDVSCCDNFGDFMQYKRSVENDIESGSFNRIEIDTEKKLTVYFPQHRDIVVVQKMLDLLENTFREELRKRASKNESIKE